MKATNTIEDDNCAELPAHHVEAFLERLRSARYSEETLRKKRRVLAALSRWMTSKNVTLAHLDESVVAFVMTCLINPPADRVRFEQGVLRLFLIYLRGEAIVGLQIAGDESTIAKIYGRYVDHLKQDRGLHRTRSSFMRRSYVTFSTARISAAAISCPAHSTP